MCLYIMVKHIASRLFTKKLLTLDTASYQDYEHTTY